MAYCELFKVITEDVACPPDPSDIQVGNTNFKAHFPSIHKSMAWCTLEPMIRQAQMRYVEPYLCPEIICCLIKDEESLTPEEKEILRTLRDTVAYYTIYHSYPLLNGAISDMGVQESFGSQGTSQPVSMWRYKNTRGYICNFADQCLDQLCQMLLALPDSSTIKEKWLASTCYKKNKNCFFLELCDFQECADIKNSRRTFLAIQTYIKKAIKTYLRPILCPEFLKELCDKLSSNDDLDECETELVELIRAVLASWAMYMAIPNLRVVVENNGIFMISSNDGIDIKRDAHNAAILEVRCYYEEQAKRCTADLCEYLYNNAEKFPTWMASACYNGEDEQCGCIHSSQDHCGAIGIF